MTEVTNHPVHKDFLCWRIVADVENPGFPQPKSVTFWVLHKRSEGAYERRLAELARTARDDQGSRRGGWKAYWSFRQSFHQVRHAFAITAHKSQGSTLNSCFVAARDILVNTNVGEARRCLYVACTRARKQLFIG